jgi:hypothetical protein
MKTTFAVVALLSAVAVHAQTTVPAFSPQHFRAHVEFLADDLLEGRDTGSRGHEIAARYVATQMASYGLEPGGDAGTWLQRVTFQKTTRGKDAGAISISGPAGEQRFAHADNVLIGLQPREPNLDLSAPLVFAGYGVEDERFGLDDYRGLDVKGCIVVVLRGFPKGLPSEEGAHLNASKGRFAEKHGAIGMLVVATLQSEKAFPWKKSLQYANDPDYAWVQPDGQAFEESPGVRARALLNGPAAEAAFAGARRTLADIRREADRVKATPRGFRLKTRVNIHTTATWERVTSPNVIGILPGADAALAKQYAVLSAHLDHLGVKQAGDDPQEDRIYNGALDNAAGVATLLEVARAAAAAPDKPRRSMIFIATTGEEKGLLGADYYARHPTVPIAQIVGNVDLDMPLLLYSFTDVIAFGANHSSIGPMVARAVAPMNIKLSPDPMPEQGVFTRSDHYRFVRQGVPAVFLATGMASGGDRFWGEFLSGTYHSTRDDTSQKIDWQAGARFAEVNYRITRAMTDSDTPPLWFEGDYFGDTFAPKAARATRQP